MHVSSDIDRRLQGLLPALVRVPGGWFRMGSDDGPDDAAPARSVRVTSFLASLTPVPRAAWQAFVAATGRPWAAAEREPRVADPAQPATCVSWEDAIAWCAWASERTGLGLVLPTEAERERAARGGLEGAAWPWGDVPPDEHPGAANLLGLTHPHAPTEGCANGYGLRCMGDNVHEWCSNWYRAGAVAAASRRSATQPLVVPCAGRLPPARRASRGGSWRHAVPFSRVAARSSLAPDARYDDYGFRPIVRT